MQLMTGSEGTAAYVKPVPAGVFVALPVAKQNSHAMNSELQYFSMAVAVSIFDGTVCVEMSSPLPISLASSSLMGLTTINAGLVLVRLQISATTLAVARSACVLKPNAILVSRTFAGQGAGNVHRSE